MSLSIKKLKVKILKKIRAFTIIELLTVIAVISLLASVALVSINSHRAKARDRKRIGDINQLAKAFELFYNDKKSYPTTGPGVTDFIWGILSAPTGTNCGDVPGCVDYLIPTYILARVPSAPYPADGSCGSPGYAVGSTQNDYQFLSTGGAHYTSSYYISFCLGGQVGSLSPGLHTLTSGGIK